MNDHHILTFREKVKYAIPLAIGFFLTYFVPNHVHLFEPKPLPILEIDKAIPFIPETIFIYMSEYFLAIVVLIFIRDAYEYRRLIIAYFATFGISLVIFTLFPTMVTFRPEIVGDGLVADLYRVLHTVDTTANAFPSQHVSLVVLPFLIFWKKHHLAATIFGVWAFLISVSTLTTKQHYLIDIFGGLALALVSVWFAKWFQKNGYVEKLPKPLRKILP